MSDVVTKRIIKVLIVVMVFSICTTIIIMTKRDSSQKSKASDSPDGNNAIDVEKLYGIDLSGETEYTINEDVDKSQYNYGLPGNVKDGTILYAWCWSFNTIKDNLDNIAKAGFCAIQTCPVNEIYVGEDGGMDLYGNGDWASQKENTDFTIGNYQLGTKEELAILCQEAHKCGLKIIVEVDPNSVTMNKDAVSDKLIKAAGGTLEKLLHKSGLLNCTINTDREQVTTYSIDNRCDINTENKAFQDYFFSFLNECIDIGVDGFEFENAQNIALEDDPNPDGETNNFWTRTMNDIIKKKDVFAYGNIQTKYNCRYADYTNLIGMTNSNDVSLKLRNCVKSWNLSAKDILACNSRDVEWSQLVVAVEDPNTYINEVWDDFGDFQIKIAWAIITARADGTPFFYDRPKDGGSVNGVWGSVNKIGAAGSDLYEDTEVAAVNRFRNAMVGEDENLFNPNDNNKILAIERGDKGIVFVNTDGNIDIDIKTKLEDGLYLNHTADDSIFRVEDGRLKGTVPKESIAVIYTESSDEVNIPVIDIRAENNNFYTDETTITLCSNKATASTFSFGGKEYSYENGKQLKFGKNMKAGDTATITLKAINNDGIVNEKQFVFTKKDEKAYGTYVKFIRPDSWAKSIYVYAYDGPTKETCVWPGTLMEYEGNGVYLYSVPTGWEDAKFVFSDSHSQYPSSSQGGLKIVSGRIYSPELDEYQN